MDRFIELRKIVAENTTNDLKSNMDRFIVPSSADGTDDPIIFKIQYG